ncbi:hypothetical protein [Oryza sativa Japonica Group]|uniref:Uncharacterized protein n=1 Tax=Oryza sativa subsp. japonica TaxID=39947 RepID=Q5N7V6_ORYSJ|nr:hypothetical protein [Oryza sativa Japonica Group]BAD82450.1 hypothetical protein [Oryza sativa Japonica Group]
MGKTEEAGILVGRICVECHLVWIKWLLFTQVRRPTGWLGGVQSFDQSKDGAVLEQVNSWSARMELETIAPEATNVIGATTIIATAKATIITVAPEVVTVAVVVVTAGTAIVVPAAGRIGRINRSHWADQPLQWATAIPWRIHLVRGCSRHPRPPLSHPPSSDWVDLPLLWALAADLPSPRPPLPSSLDWADLSLLWVLTFAKRIVKVDPLLMCNSELLVITDILFAS